MNKIAYIVIILITSISLELITDVVFEQTHIYQIDLDESSEKDLEDTLEKDIYDHVFYNLSVLNHSNNSRYPLCVLLDKFKEAPCLSITNPPPELS